MRYIKLQKEKAPVVKNTLWALKLIWKTDKSLPLSAVLLTFTKSFFEMYVKNILFLKGSQHSGSLRIADFLSFFKRIVSHGKPFIVNESAATKGLIY